MSRVRRGDDRCVRIRHPDLVRGLADELKRDRPSAQPMIDEHHFPATDAVRVAVIWDKWEDVPIAERVAIILQAYQEAEGDDSRRRVALAMGYTPPEAYESGMLPYQVAPLVRKADLVTIDECAGAMLAEGASVLFDPKKPQLRFATEDDAGAAVQRLVKRLPNSEPVWAISQEGGRIEWQEQI